MVQIIESNRKPTFAERLNRGVGAAIDEYSQFHDRNLARQQLESENEAYPSLAGLTNPKLREIALSEQLKGQSKAQQQEQKFAKNFEFDQQNYDTLKDAFGKTFADIWKSSPTGGRTALLQSALDSVARGEDVGDLLKRADAEGIDFSENPLGNDFLSEEEDFQKPPQPRDFSKRPPGYTAKEWSRERSTWRKENAPIFEKSKSNVEANKKNLLSTKNLQKLNDTRKIGEGLSAVLINPQTGEFYGAAQLAGLVSPEAQAWVKEVARFQNRAKDAFGSRVTNFDLQSYMKQFPSLLNSHEGRQRIIDMLKINYELDDLYDKNLMKVYKKYGLNGIPQEEADSLVREKIAKKVEELENEYLKVNSEVEGSQKVEVVGPDGQVYEIEARELHMLPEGFQRR